MAIWKSGFKKYKLIGFVNNLIDVKMLSYYQRSYVESVDNMSYKTLIRIMSLNKKRISNFYGWLEYFLMFPDYTIFELGYLFTGKK